MCSFLSDIVIVLQFRGDTQFVFQLCCMARGELQSSKTYHSYSYGRPTQKKKREKDSRVQKKTTTGRSSHGAYNNGLAELTVPQ